MIQIENRTFNILMVGVGGQGTILAGELLSNVLMTSGYDVKKSEVHGMSQRGGRVESHVRFGKKVESPIMVKGEADILIGFEISETLRSLEWLRDGAEVIAENRAILPYTAQVGEAKYPFDGLSIIGEAGFNVQVIDGESLAEKAGNRKTANVVLMGALAKLLPVEKKMWEDAIRSNMPEKLIEANIKAFEAGYRQ